MRPAQLAQRLDPAKLAVARMRLLERMVLTGERNVKRRTPVKRGTLRRSITHRVLTPGVRGTVGTNIEYARAVHDGAKAHIIRPATRKALAWKGAQHPVRKVKHPGQKANPFLVNGLNDSEAEFARLAAEMGDAFFASVVR